MSWGVQFRVQFMSLAGTLYTVDISSQNYSGGVTSLTGAPDTFVTNEDASGDIFTPVRIQTGYLRLLIRDTDSVIESILPTKNTQRMVTLSASGVTKWVGFLCAEAYSQPYNNNMDVVEIPVKSRLAALEDVELPMSMYGTRSNVANFIKTAFETYSGGSTPYDNVYVMSDITSYLNQILYTKINWSVFFETLQLRVEGDLTNVNKGLNCLSVLNSLCALYGLMAREYGTNLYLCQYDRLSDLSVIYWTWNQIGTIAGGSTSAGSTGLESSVAMYSYGNLRGVGNSIEFMPGAKSVEVSLRFNSINELLMSLPNTTEDNSTVYEIDKMVNGKLLIQPHHVRTGTGEVFNQLYYDDAHATPSASNYSQVLLYSCINTPIRPLATDDPTFATGSLPVRYGFSANSDSTSISVHSALMVVTECTKTEYSIILPEYIRELYSLSSTIAQEIKEGYLVLQIDIAPISEVGNNVASRKLKFGGFDSGYIRRQKIMLKLQVGNLWWNGEEWTSTESTFIVETDAKSVISNKTSDMVTDIEDGYFIPVTTPMSGTLKLSLMNGTAYQVTYPNGQSIIEGVYNCIVSSFDVRYTVASDPFVSQRKVNTYYQRVQAAGFSEDKSVMLDVGTYNYNVDSPMFIRDRNDNYIETIQYASGTERIESHLLSRMVEYYNTRRAVYNIRFESAASVLPLLFATHGGRTMFCIDQSHNWQDDTQNIKFIEI